MPVQDRQGAPGRLLASRRLHLHAEFGEPPPGTPGDLVIPQRGDQRGASRHPRQLRGRHCPAARGLLEAVGGVHDLAGRRDVIAPDELDPLDVSHHGCAPRGNRQRRTPTTAMHR
ncbi:MAG: hypothetical protein WA696_10280 [Solirubrobacterales bacterium]